MTTASITFEIEVRFEGTITPGRPEQAPAYAHGGLPADPAEADIKDVTDIGALTYKGARRWAFATLLDGVDRKSQAFLRIERNILEMFRQQAEEALFEAAQ